MMKSLINTIVNIQYPLFSPHPFVDGLRLKLSPSIEGDS